MKIEYSGPGFDPLREEYHPGAPGLKLWIMIAAFIGCLFLVGTGVINALKSRQQKPIPTLASLPSDTPTTRATVTEIRRASSPTGTLIVTLTLIPTEGTAIPLQTLEFGAITATTRPSRTPKPTKRPAKATARPAVKRSGGGGGFSPQAGSQGQPKPLPTLSIGFDTVKPPAPPVPGGSGSPAIGPVLSPPTLTPTGDNRTWIPLLSPEQWQGTQTKAVGERMTPGSTTIIPSNIPALTQTSLPTVTELPSATPTATLSATPQPSPTPIPPTATELPSATPTETPTATPQPSPTLIPPTATELPSSTPLPTDTPIPPTAIAP